MASDLVQRLERVVVVGQPEVGCRADRTAERHLPDGRRTEQHDQLPLQHGEGEVVGPQRSHAGEDRSVFSIAKYR